MGSPLVQETNRLGGAKPPGVPADKDPVMDALPQADDTIDCAGLLCPLPVLRAAKRLRAMATGAVLAVLATDRMAEIDLPHFCDQSGHIYLGMEPHGEATRHVIRCGHEILDLDF